MSQSAEGGIRTRTEDNLRGILSPLRLIKRLILKIRMNTLWTE